MYQSKMTPAVHFTSVSIIITIVILVHINSNQQVEQNASLALIKL